MNTRRIVLPLLAAAAMAAPASAEAATPESGSVGKAAPAAKWNGATTNGGVTTITAIGNGGTYACVAPTCDTFALTVTDAGGDLKVTATEPGSGGFVMVEIVKPDGSVIYNGGAEAEEKTIVAVKNAPVGEYEVRVALNSIIFESTYSAVAEWALPGAAPQEPAPAPEAPQGGQPAPQPSEQPAATLAIKAGKLSARAVAKRKRFAVKVNADKPVTDVAATLFKGSKKVAVGKLASLSGTKSVTLKVPRKLKPGSYVLNVSAKDGARVVGSKVTVKVAK